MRVGGLAFYRFKAVLSHWLRPGSTEIQIVLEVDLFCLQNGCNGRHGNLLSRVLLLL